MKCTDCKYCVLQDEGYSNWTVEGTEADCLLGENPGFPSDSWFGEDKELSFADKCPSFTAGEAVQFDVDGETTIEDYKDDEEIYDLLKSR